MAGYAKSKGRNDKSSLKHKLNSNTFTPLRHDVILSAEFHTLSNAAKSVFIVLLAKYNGFNNGDLSAPQNKAKEYFNLSDRGLKLALDELIKAEFIEQTRIGNRRQCSLYALTCFRLNTITKSGIYQQETQRPSDKWRKSKPPD